MAAALVWLEATALATWTRESPSIWAYPTILTLHTVGLAIVVGLSAVIDLRVLGFARRVPLPAFSPAFRLIAWGFVLNATTGVLLFIADAVHKAGQPVLYVKLACIIVALWLTLSVRRLLQSGAMARGEDPPASARTMALASLVLWAAAIAAGRLMAYL